VHIAVHYTTRILVDFPELYTAKGDLYPCDVHLIQGYRKDPAPLKKILDRFREQNSHLRRPDVKPVDGRVVVVHVF
jgi:hypothetical protein